MGAEAHLVVLERGLIPLVHKRGRNEGVHFAEEARERLFLLCRVSVWMTGGPLISQRAHVSPFAPAALLPYVAQKLNSAPSVPLTGCSCLGSAHARALHLSGPKMPAAFKKAVVVGGTGAIGEAMLRWGVVLRCNPICKHATRLV